MEGCCCPDISALLREGYQLKARMAADKERLAFINGVLASQATFPEGSNTARMAADGYLAKIQCKETVSWDQKALRKAVSFMGVEEFRKGFDYEYKPRSAKILKDYLAAADTPDEYRKLIDDARIVKRATPSVSYEHVGEE